MSAMNLHKRGCSSLSVPCTARTPLPQQCWYSCLSGQTDGSKFVQWGGRYRTESAAWIEGFFRSEGSFRTSLYSAMGHRSQRCNARTRSTFSPPGSRTSLLLGFLGMRSGFASPGRRPMQTPCSIAVHRRQWTCALCHLSSIEAQISSMLLLTGKRSQRRGQTR